jgi:hypothetical protein
VINQEFIAFIKAKHQDPIGNTGDHTKVER